MKWIGWVAASVWLVSCTVAAALETYAYRFATAPDSLLDLAAIAEAMMPKAAVERPQSCFVGAQDEVVDCTAGLNAVGVPLQGGWVMWNRSRQLLVARAAMLDQWQVMSLGGFDDQPRLVRTTFEWFRGVEVLDVPGGDRAADASLVIDTRSGHKASGSCEAAGDGGRWSMQAEVEPIRGYLGEVIDLGLAPEWSLRMTCKGNACWYAVGNNLCSTCWISCFYQVTRRRHRFAARPGWANDAVRAGARSCGRSSPAAAGSAG